MLFIRNTTRVQLTMLLTHNFARIWVRAIIQHDTYRPDQLTMSRKLRGIEKKQNPTWLSVVNYR
jgi:hypothetical protein